MERRALAAMAALVTWACGPGEDAPASSPGASPPEAPATSEASSPPAGSWVEIPYEGRVLHAYLALPEGEGPFPTLIVIHQNRGFDPWVGSVADRIAAEGYIALAPDLLSGMAPGGGRTPDFADADAARAGIGALEQAQVVADLDAAADWLAGHPESDGRVSVSGFCWGGRQTFAFATERPDLVAAYVFYGDGPSDPTAYANVGARVYGFYGGEDNRINATISASTAAMESAGKVYEPVIYDGAGHGFMSRGEQAESGDPNRTAMERGWERWRALLAAHRDGA